jgi:hypothetical protein
MTFFTVYVIDLLSFAFLNWKPGLEVPKKGFSGKIDLFVLYYNSHEIRTVLKCACLYGISKALGSSSCSLFSNAVYLNLFMVLEM